MSLHNQLKDLFEESQQALEERSTQLHQTAENLVSTQVALKETKQDLALTARQREEEKYLVEEHTKTEKALFQEADQVFI